MSSINGDGDAREVAIDTKLMVATDRGEGGCHGGGCGDGDEEAGNAMAMVGVTATSKKPSKEDQSSAGKINPLLLASAQVGSWEALNVLLEREDAKRPPMMIPTQEFLELLENRRPAARDGRVAARDVEEGVDHQPAPPAARALLKGVTPVGDTALHAVARNGDNEDFLKYASIIYDRNNGLLFAKNHRGDTPLHAAVRGGNSKMVSHLIGLAGREGAHMKLRLLRMENTRHETALHETVRIEDGRFLGPEDREALFDAEGVAEEERIRLLVEEQQSSIVKLLMGADPQLANYPADGVSPLYLAISLEKSTIALTLYGRSGGNLSYSGPDGQNALHVAVLRDKDTVMVKCLLSWNKSLTAQVDKDGNTPLHFASSMYFWTGTYLFIQTLRRNPWCSFVWFPWRSAWALPIVFEANPAALYQADKDGFSPIHVAASVGASKVIRLFLQEYPDSAELLDAKGRTFLHVAVEKERLGIVTYACGNPVLARILNKQDNDGNTAVHLAIQAGSFRMFGALFGNREVNLNLPNNQGKTPHDLSRSKLPSGMWSRGKPEYQIYHTLESVGANHGALRCDKNEEKYGRRLKSEDQDKESEMLKDATQRYIVASVLIANMAFVATFSIPGGYRADDQRNGGTPTLAGGYFFDVFIVATDLAFICSLLATTGFMLAGVPMVSLKTRKIYLMRSETSFLHSVTCMSIAFALGVYMMLAPVARKTAIAVCVVTPVVVVCRDVWRISEWGILIRAIVIRKGPFLGTARLVRWSVWNVFAALWPLVVTFGWPGLARIHWSHYTKQ